MEQKILEQQQSKESLTNKVIDDFYDNKGSLSVRELKDFFNLKHFNRLQKRNTNESKKLSASKSGAFLSSCTSSISQIRKATEKRSACAGANLKKRTQESKANPNLKRTKRRKAKQETDGELEVDKAVIIMLMSDDEDDDMDIAEVSPTNLASNVRSEKVRGTDIRPNTEDTPRSREKEALQNDLVMTELIEAFADSIIKYQLDDIMKNGDDEVANRCTEAEQVQAMNEYRRLTGQSFPGKCSQTENIHNSSTPAPPPQHRPAYTRFDPARPAVGPVRVPTAGRGTEARVPPACGRLPGPLSSEGRYSETISAKANLPIYAAQDYASVAADTTAQAVALTTSRVFITRKVDLVDSTSDIPSEATTSAAPDAIVTREVEVIEILD